MAALGAAILLHAAPAIAAGWRQRIDDVIGRRHVGVSVRLDGNLIYAHEDRNKRVPASNQKLLMTMALMDRIGYRRQLPTIASARTIDGHVVRGDLWLLGRGDPTVTDGGSFAGSLPFEPTRLGRLAKRIKRAGIRRITGTVMGSTDYFSHDWYATGWKPDFPAEEVPMPTALTFDGNRVDGTHIADPERRAADGLVRQLRKRGVRVGGPAAQGAPPESLTEIARVKSRTLKLLLRYMNRQSSNYFAEVLGKRLAVETFGRPGTIAKAARAIERFAAKHDVGITAYDSSGLSYSNRVSPRGMGKLLTAVEDRNWVRVLRDSLPKGDQGTLDDRLRRVPVRAKTGTLEDISTLSGWVWLDRSSRWCAFSIMSRGMDKSKAAEIEDRIVRILSNSAR